MGMRRLKQQLIAVDEDNDAPSSRPVVLVVTAHPDDECMFFSPAIVGMLELGASVHIECLSNGNYDGLGRVREKELVASCEILGVTGPDHVRCIEDERLQDHSSVGWDAEVVAETVDAAVKRVNATMILTFDSYGVSGHINHRSVYAGVKHYISSTKSIKGVQIIPAYALESVSLARKYTSILDLFLSFTLFSPLQSIHNNNNTTTTTIPKSSSSSSITATTTKRKSSSKPSSASSSSSTPLHPYAIQFIASPSQVRQAQCAMQAHASQLVWFRWLYILTSRYLLVNDFHKITSYD